MSRVSPPVVGRRHRLLAGVVAVAFGLLGALLPAGSASAAGSVTGRLIDQLTPGQPAAGVEVQFIQRTGGSGTVLATTDSNGVFTAPLPADELYEAFIPEGTMGTGGQTFGIFARQFTVVPGGTFDLGDLVVRRYVPVTGTITNFSSTMGPVRVDIFFNAGVGWNQVNISPSPNSVVSTDGDFTIYVPIDALTYYTLRFTPQNEDSPFADAYLGGGYYPDAPTTTHLAGTPGVGFSGITMTMPSAASISGTVTDSDGEPIEGIWVWAEDPASEEYTETQTDADGHYTLYVRPDLTYAVWAEDWDNNIYQPELYDGWDGCGCIPFFTPVTAPMSSVDFTLTDGSSPSTDLQILGFVADVDTNYYLFGVDVRLFRASGNSWVLAKTMTSYDFGFLFVNFGFVVDALGDDYRIQFVDADGHILRVFDGGTSPDFSTITPFDPVPACYANLGEVSVDTLVFAIVDPATSAGACASLDAPAGGSGGSGSTPKPGFKGSSVPSSTLTHTPSATPTPTPSATPRPSASPTPSATPEAAPPPASAPDLWWLLWVIIGILLIVIVGGVVYFVRRT